MALRRPQGKMGSYFLRTSGARKYLRCQPISSATRHSSLRNHWQPTPIRGTIIGHEPYSVSRAMSKKQPADDPALVTTQGTQVAPAKPIDGPDSSGADRTLIQPGGSRTDTPQP